MRLPKAILLDLDDTIITEGDRLAILLEVAEEFAAALKPHPPSDVADRLDAALQAFWSSTSSAKAARLGKAGFGIRQARESIIAQTFQILGLTGMPDIAVQFCHRFSDLRARNTGIFPGARETIESLKAAGVLLALVTNGATDIQRAKIARFNLAVLFNHIQIEGEHGFGKPEEIAYMHAMQVLEVEPSETWMVGDNLEWEVAAPQRLGIYGIWHDHLRRGLPAGNEIRPDRIITHLAELLR
ncbi:putative hydrolase of the HAD superfamily [Bosea sp. OK403]|uniref:HAD family hydrolase n=1 Tax=Bosea sp. OK403 TaxID=1855286 RepID=UPI0008E13D2D|nr:HAD family hydrolase [Bosea sp. OK403]SFJ70123.1 putative hydrolase of the HAD superfamily [Bosea sp. OK403]